MNSVFISQTTFSWPSFHGPVPKKFRSPLPSHIGTAVGGFGLTIDAAGASLTALVVQAEMSGRQLISAKPATGGTWGKAKTRKTGYL